MQFKHTLVFTLTLIDVRNVFIECDGVFKLHIHLQVVFTELWTTRQEAIISVWEPLSVIKTIQFAFLLLLLMSVPDFIDYLKKALIRFDKLA